MTHVTCSLTAKNRDQLRNPTLGNRVWATFTFLPLDVLPVTKHSVLNCTTQCYPNQWLDLILFSSTTRLLVENTVIINLGRQLGSCPSNNFAGFALSLHSICHMPWPVMSYWVGLSQTSEVYPVILTHGHLGVMCGGTQSPPSGLWEFSKFLSGYIEWLLPSSHHLVTDSITNQERSGRL